MNREIASQAVAALYTHLDNVRDQRKVTKTIAGDKRKTQMFEEDDYVSLIVGFKTIDGPRNDKPKKISVPHSLYDGKEFCIFVKDPQSHWKNKFSEQGIKINKVIGLTKLRNNYKTFESKRKLVQSYDLFFADTRILPLLSNLLGKTFFIRKKQPVPVKITKQDLKKEFADSIRSTSYFQSGGVCSAIKIAPTNFSQEKTLENLHAVIEGLTKITPKGWANIQSLNIKTSSSVALPLYSSLRAAKTTITNKETTVAPSIIEKKKAKEAKKADVSKGDKKKKTVVPVTKPVLKKKAANVSKKVSTTAAAVAAKKAHPKKMLNAQKKNTDAKKKVAAIKKN